ncbi:hypothetical protein SDC9_206524 [bioreactor metagenome]|uniref:Uncharacterized protein n=1 Tax=bioreactor metagenome TaxID=1076179 RepID=A0A645J7Z2_9ZZZZ
MTSIGAEGTQILQEDNLSPSGKQGGNHDGLDFPSRHIDARDFSDVRILSDGFQVLSDFSLEEEVREHAQSGNDEHGKERNPDHIHRR